MSEFTAQDRILFQRLLDESDCRNLLQRYSNIVDWKDWEALPGLLWPDASFDFGMWAGDCPAFLTWVAELEGGYQRRLHLFSIQRLEVTGDSAFAEVVTANHLRLKADDGGGQDDLLFGRYQFGLSQREGEWRLQSLRFLLHGSQRFRATDDGGAPFFADGLDSNHPHFRARGILCCH